MADSSNTAVLLRVTPEQRQQLKEQAAREGLTVQEWLELKVFGELRPRKRPPVNRPPHPIDRQGALPISA